MIYCTQQQKNILRMHNEITIHDLVLVAKALEIYPEGKAVETAFRMKG